MVERSTITQVIGSLMKNPQFLSEVDKYNLTPNDFEGAFAKYIFSAINNLYSGGAVKITEVDVDMYFQPHPTAKTVFETNNGIEYLIDAQDLAEPENFSFYYTRLKKFNALRDLKKMGFNTNTIYTQDLTDPKYKEKNDRFEEMDVGDIFETIKKGFTQLEKDYQKGTTGQVQSADHGIENLLSQLQVSPDVGAPLQGDVFNTVVRGARKGRYYLRSASSGTGKAIPNNTSIPTPNGWKTVGEIKVGDFIFDGQGNPTKVLGVYPQGLQDVWEVEFKDGRKALCNDEHLWSYNTRKQRPEWKRKRKFFTNTLKEINERGLRTNDGKGYNISVPLTGAVNYEEKKYKISPYSFGLMLGDGSFRSGNTAFSYSSEDEYLPKQIAIENGWTFKKTSKFNYGWTFKFKEPLKKGRNLRYSVYVSDILEDFPDLINASSLEKYIPEIYLMGSVEQRFDLLNGLLDSDGSICEAKGRVNIQTHSPRMKDNIVSLVQSLGGKATVGIDTHKETSVGYIIHITGTLDFKAKLFRLPRKVERRNQWLNNGKRKEHNFGNPIVKITDMGYQTEMTCFYVDNEEHLFLMNDYIVTHNTRSLIGDMCHLSYPVRFNRETFEWEMSGSAEKTLFVSTEQEIDEIQTAILSYLTGINEEEILYQRYTALEGKIVQQAIEVMKLYSQNIFIVTMPDPSIEKIKALVRQEWLIHDINNVVYDYLHESGSLLNEFRDLRMRTDQVLGQLSTTLKELAVEMNLFMFSATQLNAKGEETGALKGEGSIRGSRAIVDKCDIACILDRIEPEEIDRLEDVIQLIGIVPNQVTDIYKVRRGRFTRVKIWSYMDLGTCRKRDLFITNERYGEVENFKVHNFIMDFESEQFKEVSQLVDKLNGVEEKAEEKDNFRF